MAKQKFTKTQFSYLTKRSDYKKYFSGNELDKTVILDRIEKSLDFTNYEFSSLKQFEIRNKRVFSLSKSKTFEVIRDDFVLRKINQNIKRVYKVKQANRHQICSCIQALLSHPKPFFLCKLDIQSFYETIERDTIQELINSSALISFETKVLLQKFLSTLPEFCTGLPRGINISATLSELYMKKFDQAITTRKDFFYYARYVDDIIIFSTEPFTKKLIKELSLLLPKGLYFNCNKTERIFLDDDKSNDTVNIDYLGYRFVCSKIITSNRKREVNVEISPKKIKKIKTRLVTSFLNYSKHEDFELLKKRILFLSATYPLKSNQKRLSKYESSGFLHGGIAYSYPLITNLNCLKQLDTFFHSLLNLDEFEKFRKMLTSHQICSLKKYSFFEGFKRRISRRFSIDTLDEIVRCWH